MRLEDYPTKPRFDALILRTEQITDESSDAEVRELILEIDQNQFDYEIGQSIGVLVKGLEEFFPAESLSRLADAGEIVRWVAPAGVFWRARVPRLPVRAG